MIKSIADSLQRFSLSSASSLAEATKLITHTKHTRPDKSTDDRVCRLIRHNGHEFEATLLTEPTKCSFCDKMIWLPHGQQCKLCKLVSHTKCVNMIEVSCKNQSRAGGHVGGFRPNSTPKHKLKSLKTVLSPTMCDHCGTYIIVYRQYYECSSCSRNFHHDCFTQLMTDECRPRSHDRTATRYENTSRMTIDDFDVLGLLGTGSFSRVYLARRKMEEKDDLFAIKIIKKTSPVVNGDPEGAFNEWKCLQLGRSYPFLTIAHCCFQSRDRLFFVMEYVQGKDLLYYINEQGAFSEDRVRFHSAEIVLALMYMHKNDIIYRDLKLNNVILDQYGHCKLIDFGMSKKLSVHTQMRTNTFCGTVFYLSPEILKGESYDCSIDWWSLGVLMYELLCDRLPFNGKTDEEIFSAIKFHDVTYPDNIKLSERARSVLDGFLTKDPRKRLGCDLMEDYALAIKKHPFFWPENGDNTPSDRWWQDVEAMRLKPPYVPSQSLDGRVFRSGHIEMTPIKSSEIDEIPQSCFDNFSQYSRSFLESG